MASTIRYQLLSLRECERDGDMISSSLITNLAYCVPSGLAAYSENRWFANFVSRSRIYIFYGVENRFLLPVTYFPTNLVYPFTLRVTGIKKDPTLKKTDCRWQLQLKEPFFGMWNPLIFFSKFNLFFF